MMATDPRKNVKGDSDIRWIELTQPATAEMFALVLAALKPLFAVCRLRPPWHISESMSAPI